MLKKNVTNKWKNRLMLSMGVLVLPALLVSCSSDKEPTVDASKEPSGGISAAASDTIKKLKETPLELTVFGSHNHADFMRHYGRVINRTYPNITFNVIGGNLQDTITAGTTVDIFYAPSIDQAVAAGILDFDTTPLLKKFNIDLSKLNAAAQNLLTKENNGVVNPLAFSINPLTLIYNKDIFDRFGQAYPKDGMTWNEVIDLTRKMTRDDNGVSYIGFTSSFWANYFRNNQFGAPIIDPVTVKSSLDSKWTEMFQLFSQLGPKSAEAFETFEKEQRVAMYMGLVSQAISPLYNASVKNLDMVTLPDLPNNKDYGAGLIVGYIGVSSNSKHKEEALLAITELITLEGQTYRARVNGAFPTMDIPNIENILSADEPLVKGKNIKALFKKNYGTMYSVGTSYGVIGSPQVTTAFYNVVQKGNDINTELRLAEENINKAIDTAKAALKK